MTSEFNEVLSLLHTKHELKDLTSVSNNLSNNDKIKLFL